MLLLSECNTCAALIISLFVLVYNIIVQYMPEVDMYE